MVVAPFLEIQRKMLPRHLRLKGTQTKVLVLLLPVWASHLPSSLHCLPQLVPSSEQFCLRNVSHPSLSACTPQMSLCVSLSSVLAWIKQPALPSHNPTPAPLAPQWQTLHTEARVDFSKVMV